MRLACVLFLALLTSLPAAELPAGIEQLVVSIAPSWDSTRGKLQRFERTREGWRAVGDAVPALYGSEGLAWGRGLLGTDEEGRKKVERDKRAPAGAFRIGKIYTYDAQLPRGADFPYRTITNADAWIDDPALAEYNRHVVIDPRNPPPWFEKQKMRHGDFAYRWLVEVRHNSDPPKSGAGSAIFFHIRRGATRPTAGCTTLAEDDLVELIRWLRADRQPTYALLPWAEYREKWRAWGLPSPEEATALAP